MLTNDGEFVYKITHPKHEVEKTYIATIGGKIKEEEIENLRAGIKIEDYTTRRAKVKILKYDDKTNKTNIEITIHEGKNRQVRKMFEKIGHKVIKLHRSKIGILSVKNMKFGEWRYLNSEEIEKLLDK